MVPPPPLATGWVGDVDRTVAKATCKAEVAMAAVRAVVDALLEEINVAPTSVEVVAGARRSRKSGRSASRASTGEQCCAGWRDVVVSTPSGGQEPLLIGADTNPQILRREVHTKKALDMLARMCPGGDLLPSRRNVVISSRHGPLVKVEVDPADTILKFNGQLVDELGMSKAPILQSRAWESATASPSVQWNS